jgi:hypothetical protein
MANQSGSVYGLTLLCPILNDERAVPSHDLQIREYLATMPTDERSPFATAPGTHMARLVVMDDVVYVGMPACEEHLKSKYLIFETNCDADIDAYFTGLAKGIPEHLDAIWSHCTGYPGVSDLNAFLSYMKACQLETTFFFAAVNDKSVTDTLKALQTQRAVADFIATHPASGRSMDAAVTQREFLEFVKIVQAAPVLRPGLRAKVVAERRDIQTGGHNE